MKRILICSIAFFVFFAQGIFAENIGNAQVSIKLYDKTVYYPSAVQNNPIHVHVSIANRGSNTLRFKLADDRAFSLDFTVITAKNAKLNYTSELVRKRSTSQTVYFREISLEPEEEYAFVVNLKDYLDINHPSIYYFELSFYPELYKSKTNSIKSNRLSLEISPDTGIGASVFLPVDYDTAALLKPEALAPDKIIEQTIIARQRSLWDQFFLYMDIESILKKDEISKRKYNSASEQERQTMITNFKKTLSSALIDSDIAAIPEKFKIEKTSYTETEGTVSVLEWFKYSTFREKKRYTYYLRLRDDIWQIYDYSVDNLGTE